jgi:membrane protease YdiL (CAAX protease family)
MAPIVEELYFRGFLLPRMTWMGKAAPVVNTLLFALYHFWTPWQVITRVLALVPTVYIVNTKRNIYIGIMVHCLMNIVGDALGVLLLVLK